MPDSVEPPLRTVFVEQACEVLYDAFDAGRREVDNWPEMPATWPTLNPVERSIALASMDHLLDWIDSRRL